MLAVANAGDGGGVLGHRRLFRRGVGLVQGRSRLDHDLTDHAHRSVRFAHEIVGSVHAALKGETVVDGSSGLTRVEHAVVLHSVVRQGLAAPKETDRVALGDGHRGRRKAQVGAVDRDDHRLRIVFLRHQVTLKAAGAQQQHRKHNERTHVQK